ncbi:terminase [Amycolatopsis suaedae]|uniref:Terminase n=1 Tax=Amycolatopsis suaedae TaxID=2510978 RepID=A0A4Q7IZB8_9PSEU|nr:terminase [Amycolatopsis suaedae]RZQ59829.1 terminase [Amycolatopsis suaedae]
MASLLLSPPSTPSLLRGAAAPRVEWRPPTIVGSYGGLAADLMAAAGKPYEPWQRDGVDLMMSTRPDGKWACYEYAEWVARQNGKGGLGEGRALAGFFGRGEELIIWSAHEYKTALEAFRKIRRLIRALGAPLTETLVDVDGVMVKISNTNGEEGFERLDTEQRIKFVARSKGSGRGFSGDCNIIDEAFAYTPEQQDALMPTLIARPNAQIIYLSSPPLTGDTGEVMFELKARAEAGGDDSLGYRDWGIAGHLDDRAAMNLDDRGLWAQANPALGYGRVTEETIGKLRRSMTSNQALGFAREVLGLWPKRVAGGGAIDMARWVDLADSMSKRRGDVALGVDISPARDYASIALYGVRDDELGHVQLVDYRADTGWIVARLVELKAALDPLAVGMGRGTYASLKTDLDKVGLTVPEDPAKPKRGELAVTTAVDMAAACGHVLDAVKQGTFRHLGQTQLDEAVAGARTKQTADAIAWARKDGATDIAPLVALTVARWAYTTRVDLIVTDDGPNLW